MTEDEAKTKWCPYAMNNACTRNSHKHDDLIPEKAHCVASSCMMWRTTDNECSPKPMTDGRETECKPAGYCGLGGKV